MLLVEPDSLHARAKNVRRKSTLSGWACLVTQAFLLRYEHARRRRRQAVTSRPSRVPGARFLRLRVDGHA